MLVDTYVRTSAREFKKSVNEKIEKRKSLRTEVSINIVKVP